MSAELATRVARIRLALEQNLKPVRLEIVDESEQHRGHAGAQTGKGHFRVILAAAKFSGHTLLARHRLVYAALGDLLQTDIHALSIDAKSPEELPH